MVYRRPIRREVEVEDDYPVYESGSSGPAAIFMVFLVILVLGWLITKTENGSRNIGATVETAPLAPPVYTQPAPVVVNPVINPVVAPVVAYETVPAPEVVGRTKIRSDDVNLRTGPGFEYEPSFLLARNVTVAILNQSHTGIDGETWVKVGIETPQGPVRGWVNRRFIAY